MNECNNIWNKDILNIHNLHRKPAIYLARKSSIGVWNNIAKVVNCLEEHYINTLSLFKLISLCEDRKCGHIPFQSRFPRLYQLESVKGCMLRERVSCSGFSWKLFHPPFEAER
ncbi:hypothetical protein LXL04_013954 [Taraxacum kok-saghyz]